jgi:hypothetical protein
MTDSPNPDWIAAPYEAAVCRIHEPGFPPGLWVERETGVGTGLVQGYRVLDSGSVESCPRYSYRLPKMGYFDPHRQNDGP